MNSFKKYILFFCAIFMQTTIQSASLFKNAKGEARAINPWDQAMFKEIKDYADVPINELFVVIGPNDSHVKLAFFEQKPNGKYQVNFFMIQQPNISAEFSSENEAQDFLYDFMVKPPVVNQRPFYIPVQPRKPGYDWRKVPQTRRR